MLGELAAGGLAVVSRIAGRVHQLSDDDVESWYRQRRQTHLFGLSNPMHDHETPWLFPTSSKTVGQ